MIKEFQGQYRWLSNFWMAPIMYKGIKFPSTENAYQAAKFSDESFKLRIAAVGPSEAKKMGTSRVKRIPDHTWHQMSLNVMYEVNLIKYVTHADLCEMLLDTYPQILQEGNTWGDTFWGVCKGKGENHLGKTLMKVRYIIRQYPHDQRWMLLESER